MPVTAQPPTTDATLMAASRQIHAVIPVARARAAGSGARWAMRTAAKRNQTKRASTQSVPMRPSSSPTIVKMKSVCGLGSSPHFSRLWPRPSPVTPPAPSPILDCRSW